MQTQFLHARPEYVHDAILSVLGSLFPTVTAACLTGPERGNQAVAWMRQAGMYVMCVRFDISQHQAARCFRRDRTTVRHAIELVGGLIAGDPTTAALIDMLEAHARTRLAAVEADEAIAGVLPALRAGWAQVMHG